MPNELIVILMLGGVPILQSMGKGDSRYTQIAIRIVSSQLYYSTRIGNVHGKYVNKRQRIFISTCIYNFFTSLIIMNSTRN